MKKSRLLGAVCGCSFIFSSNLVNASLVAKLNGEIIYDTDWNISWIADAGLQFSNTFGLDTSSSSGFLSLSKAQEWIQAMNTSNYLGFNDWRLPTTLVPDASCGASNPPTGSYNCAGSEMGHLFYDEFSGVAGQSIRSYLNTDPDVDLFSNFSNFSEYWSSTTSGSSFAWVFDFDRGNQFEANKSGALSALVVRNGGGELPDYVASPVPVPAAIWLFCSGLLGLVGISQTKESDLTSSSRGGPI